MTILLDKARQRQTRISGGILIGIALLLAVFLAPGAVGDATFRLSRPNDVWPVPNLVVPGGAFIYVVSALAAFLGVRLFLRGGAKWAPLILGAGLAIAVAAFLVWATAGKSFSLTGMLQASLVRAVPIALGGLAGVLSERVAVVNIGIEGMLLAGAFTGALVGSLAGGIAGLAAAVAVGGVFGFVLAALVVTYRMDQIIAGVFINLFVLGVTSYVSSQVFQEYRALNNAPVFRAVEIPILSDLPVIGPVLFNQNIFVYGAFILAGLATYYLFHTRYGLRARAVGEHPRAADTLGINVYRTRYVNVTGLPEGRRENENLSSAMDQARLARYAVARTGSDDLRALAPGRRASRGTGFRVRRLAPAKTCASWHADPVGIPRHGALYRHHRRRRGRRRTRARTGCGRQALCQGIDWSPISVPTSPKRVRSTRRRRRNPGSS